MAEERVNQHKMDQGRFSEDEIKKKLYGEKKGEHAETLRPKATDTPADKKAPVRDQSRDGAADRSLFESSPPAAESAERKVRESVKGNVPESKASEAVPGSAPQEIIRQLQQELAGYKEKIAHMERQLRQSEEQNERLKKKISLKEGGNSSGVRPRPLPGFVMPDKSVLIVPVIVIVILLLLVVMIRARAGRQPLPETESQESLAVPAAPPAPPAVSTAVERPAAAAPVTGQKQFTIQVMEFALQDAADRFVAQLKQEGYEVLVQQIYRANDRSRPYFKVSVGLFNTIEEARRFNESFQQKKGIADSFIREWRQ